MAAPPPCHTTESPLQLTYASTSSGARLCWLLPTSPPYLPWQAQAPIPFSAGNPVAPHGAVKPAAGGGPASLRPEQTHAAPAASALAAVPVVGPPAAVPVSGARTSVLSTMRCHPAQISPPDLDADLQPQRFRSMPAGPLTRQPLAAGYFPMQPAHRPWCSSFADPGLCPLPASPEQHQLQW